MIRFNRNWSANSKKGHASGPEDKDVTGVASEEPTNTACQPVVAVFPQDNIDQFQTLPIFHEPVQRRGRKVLLEIGRMGAAVLCAITASFGCRPASTKPRSLPRKSSPLLT